MNLVRTALILCAPLAMSSCITPYVRDGSGPGGVIQRIDDSGVTMTPQGVQLYEHEGVPAELFDGQQHNHLTPLAWHQAQEMRMKILNEP